MGRRQDFPDNIAEAYRSQLQSLVDEANRKRGGPRGGLRDVGVMLGFPEKSAQQQVSAALNGRVGFGMAEKICTFLGVSHEEFLRSKGIVPPPSLYERVLCAAAKMDLPAADALVVAQSLISTEDWSDEEIERLLEQARSRRSQPEVRRIEDYRTLPPAARILAKATGHSVAPEEPASDATSSDEVAAVTEQAPRRSL
jgi:hypothetical protein